ncbi:ESPR-type extended signal peptide-containing protein, partial [Haemophilus haemolyticus]|uniref:ESPR-type extended signal peptide-containing protein n=1 Tax=Haemophilus haemolyticus TaxID=726 RepID=UPI00116FEBBB
MNKIFRIVWNEAAQAWVAVSELTKKHKKRASVTAVAAALVAGALSPFAQASGGASQPPSIEFDPEHPSYSDNLEVGDNNYKFGLVVVGKDGTVKTDFGDTDETSGKATISVEPTEGSDAKPTNKSSYLYLRENGGITIEQEGRSAKFSVNAGDGLKVNDGEGEDGKLVADTVELTVSDGTVTAPDEANKKKLVNAGDLSTALNELGWKVTADSTTSTVQSGNEVEFKGEGGITVTNEAGANGKHIITIKAAQPQGGGAAGGSAPVTAGDGISVSADNKVSVKPKDKGGLTVGTDGVSVTTDNATIKVDAEGKVAAVTGAIENNAGNAQAKAGDGDKLTTVANVADAINAAKTAVTNADDTTVVKLADDGKTYKVAAKVADNKGLEKTADGLTVKAGTGVTVDASGVSVNADGTTIKLDDAGKVAAVTGAIENNAGNAQA